MDSYIKEIRSDFPILSQKVYDKPLVYFDNGATTQKPRIVIDKITKLFTEQYSSIHRGVHYLSEQSTEMYEQARITIQKYINAKFSQEVIFTSGATGSINAVAFSFGEKYVHEGDEIIISAMEHHSNIVPWQMLCERKKAHLKVIPFTEEGELRLDVFKSLLNKRTRIVAVNHVSNTLGTINPVKDIIDIAHEASVPVLIDGAQAIQHMQVDVQDLNCDFYVFSGHKVYGPTGIGVLYGKQQWLYDMPPYQGGGDMVDCVTFEHTTYNELPFKFEAGTSNFVSAIGLGTAIEYLQSLDLSKIASYEHELLQYATRKLEEIKGLRIYGNARNKISIVSFLVDNIHPYDMGMILDKMGIAVRTGSHCTQPLLEQYQIQGTIRASLVFYNTFEEIDYLVEAVKKAKVMLS
ncbi:MAG TPA: cysteine desulfurase [Bacteroidales bacterium]|nr:cysteine desulfurase [Bacteroidales bacterium]